MNVVKLRIQNAMLYEHLFLFILIFRKLLFIIVIGLIIIKGNINSIIPELKIYIFLNFVFV